MLPSLERQYSGPPRQYREVADQQREWFQKRCKAQSRTKNSARKSSSKMDGRNALQPAYLLAALKDRIKLRDMPIEERKYGKWGCWLEEYAPFVAKQLKAERAVMVATHLRLVNSSILKLYPDSKSALPGFVSESAWIVVRHSCAGADGKVVRHVQAYPDEKTAREKSAIPCAKAECDSASHIVRSLSSVRCEVWELESPDE